MQDLFFDFESFWDDQVSLRKLNYVDYCRHPDFRVMGCGVALGATETPIYLEPDQVGDYLHELGTDVRAIAHNCQFDATVLWELYKYRPRAYGCTKKMHAGLFPHEWNNLEHVARKFVGDGKLAGALENVKGRYWEDLTPAERRELAGYGVQDVVLLRQIWQAMVEYMPPGQLSIIDMLVRMCAVGEWDVDVKAMLRAADESAADDERLFQAAGMPRIQLSSNARFVKWMEETFGEVPMKEGKTRGSAPIPALGQDDPEFIDFMLEHPEQQPVWDARVAAKSRIMETRTRRLAKMGEGGPIGAPLNYYGAHTGRLSGGGRINMQNLPWKGKDVAIRKALHAPKGMQVVACDSAQIELRVNCALAGEQWVLDAFKQGDDVYVLAAAEFLVKEVSEISKLDRQLGKVMELGLGFGMGRRRFRRYLASGPMGMKPLRMTLEQASDLVNAYRDAHPNIVKWWKTLDRVTAAMLQASRASGAKSGWNQLEAWGVEPETFDLGPIEMNGNILELPNGMALDYPNMYQVRNEEGRLETCYGPKGSRLYGAKLCENITQAVANVIISEQALEINRRYDVQLLCHDEVVFFAPDEEAEEARVWSEEVMSVAPTWLDVPLAAEAHRSDSYGKW